MKKYFFNVLRNQYADFKGQTNQKEFWLFLLYNFITFLLYDLVVVLVFSILFVKIPESLIKPWHYAYFLIVLVPTIAIFVRRFKRIERKKD